MCACASKQNVDTEHGGSDVMVTRDGQGRGRKVTWLRPCISLLSLVSVSFPQLFCYAWINRSFIFFVPSLFYLEHCSRPLGYPHCVECQFVHVFVHDRR